MLNLLHGYRAMGAAWHLHSLVWCICDNRYRPLGNGEPAAARCQLPRGETDREVKWHE
jgi:hypothetical protein